jgi:hypothetical protein
MKLLLLSLFCVLFLSFVLLVSKPTIAGDCSGNTVVGTASELNNFTQKEATERSIERSSTSVDTDQCVGLRYGRKGKPSSFSPAVAGAGGG